MLGAGAPRAANPNSEPATLTARPATARSSVEPRVGDAAAIIRLEGDERQRQRALKTTAVAVPAERRRRETDEHRVVPPRPRHPPAHP